LKLLYYGMETGDDAVLKAVNKGVSGPEAVEAGRRVVAAGMKLSIMIILGLAGAKGSDKHARETAKAINEIKPNMLSAITLMIYRGSELLDQYERGEFDPLPPRGIMLELHKIISLIDLPAASHCLFRSNHVSNYVQLAGTLPKDKDKLLTQIDYAAEELGKLKDWDVYNDSRY
ncbi:MAG: radical SAM protein, partial [Negativicutes bacterium]|nr:radical SAM protein [Negativicutes bacterium]